MHYPVWQLFEDALLFYTKQKISDSKNCRRSFFILFQVLARYFHILLYSDRNAGLGCVVLRLRYCADIVYQLSGKRNFPRTK